MSQLPVEAPITKLDKFKALSGLSKALDKEHSTTNSLVRMGDRVGVPVPSTATGMPTVDHYILGCGGIPKGRIVEIYGPESAGKTSFVLHLIGKVQKLGGVAAFVDAEHALDPNWAQNLGVNMEDLFVSQPDYGEQALQVVEALIDSKAVDIIVVDSVAALVPKSELEGDMGDSNMGVQARLMSQAMRKLTGKVAKSNVCLIFINQIREKIGVMFGSPETTTGGRALKFFSSVRIDVRRKEIIKGPGDVPIGNVMKVKAVKNKCGSPYREGEVRLMYDGGFDIAYDQFEYALREGVIEKNGNTYSFNGTKLAVGKDAAVSSIREEVGMSENLAKAITQKIVDNAQKALEAKKV